LTTKVQAASNNNNNMLAIGAGSGQFALQSLLLAAGFHWAAKNAKSFALGSGGARQEFCSGERWRPPRVLLWGAVAPAKSFASGLGLGLGQSIGNPLESIGIPLESSEIL